MILKSYYLFQAIHSYRLAASQGHLEALYNLGGIYLEGKVFN